MKILITGGISGLGYGVAKELALKGHIVYIGVRTKEEETYLNEKLKREKLIMFPLVLDLTNDNYTIPNDIDILYLNASLGKGGSILEVNSNYLTDTFNVNILGNVNLIKKYLKNRKKGRIVLTSSLAGFLPLPYIYSYTYTKLSLYHLANTLRLECLYQGLDIEVSTILPGAYYTGFNQVMIDNKDKSSFIYKDKALKMTKYQHILFNLLEKKDLTSFAKKISKEITKKHLKRIISLPYDQFMFTKLYLFVKWLLFI